MTDSASTGAAQTRRHEDIMVVVIDHPPVNALSATVRRTLSEAIAQAQTDTRVRAILLIGAGKNFIAGADIREFGKPPQPPLLPDLCNQIEASVKPDEKRDAWSTATHSAVFVEVRVDEDLGTIKVSRVVSAIAAGRIVNPKTAGTQIVGGVVWGIGQALHEETLIDHRLGRYMNHNLAEYHIPVNADIPEVEVIFVEEHDEVVNELGSKGVGEIGIVGVAAAVANAIYNATGKRVRDLPITLDKLL